MRDPHRSTVGSASHSMLFVSVGCAALIVLLSSCSAGIPLQRGTQHASKDVLPLLYSIVFVIHGDGDYVYHDTSGNEYNADEMALAEAKMVALQNPLAEVFIFHQMPERHFLFFFPLHDGEFYYYRNGRLMEKESYWRNQGHSRLDPEAALYRGFRADNQRKLVKVFLYCGHEIPEVGGLGYDASHSDWMFTVHDIAVGLQGFTGDSTKFDLMVLSTCFGGTPYTIEALGPFARYIIASPDYLHLSYFNFYSLERLDLSLQDGNVHAFAKKFAQQAFDKLTADVQTVVSVAVYDVDRVQGYLHSVEKTYDHTLTSFKGETEASMALAEHCDCADVPAYTLPAMNEGVDVLYRPARFGQSKNKQHHSGWECWRDIEPRGSHSQTTESILK